MITVGRSWSVGSDKWYRFGFQNQEKDNEIKGDGNSLNFKYRMYDSRIGKFFAVDPITAKYPMLTPYQFASNNPIWMREIEGLEGEPTSVTEMDYDKLEENFPDDGQEIIRKDGSALNYLPENTNTCAIKMSECLNNAGYEIPTSQETPANVKIQNGNENDNGNYVLDAKSMSNYLNNIENPTYKFTSLTTDTEINNAISAIHKSDDLKGIMVLTAGDRKAYGASGHVDLIYEDWLWDLSIYSYGGKDLIDYLKDNKDAKLTLEIWVLEED